MNAILFGQIMFSGLSTTVAIAAVATLGYLVGRKSRISEGA